MGARRKRRDHRSFHDAAGHALRRLIPRLVAAPPARRGAGESDPALAAFIAECDRIGTSEEAIETAEKRGYRTGIEAIHPLDKDRRVPVYVANFVLMEYGTGAIFGCPAHDQRDLDFARKYDLPVIPVVLPPGEDPTTLRSATPPMSRTARCSIRISSTA